MLATKSRRKLFGVSDYPSCVLIINLRLSKRKPLYTLLFHLGGQDLFLPKTKFFMFNFNSIATRPFSNHFSLEGLGCSSGRLYFGRALRRGFIWGHFLHIMGVSCIVVLLVAVAYTSFLRSLTQTIPLLTERRTPFFFDSGWVDWGGWQWMGLDGWLES
ncbi:hypothetical protein EYC80_001288 [Monilinia laxa]|uniref:Uncharacterized protein n=1 Tax=Monilinia laxa TaxID=61186 RepID=A0A5N6K8R6_MONLA|nr:hypothetical protein EYC80_001288 [Monilinia laxa]